MLELPPVGDVYNKKGESVKVRILPDYFLILIVKLIIYFHCTFFHYFRSGIYSCRNTEKYANCELRTLQKIENY